MDEIDQSKIDAFNEQQRLIADENAKTEDMALAVSLILNSQKEVKQAIGQTLQDVVKFLNEYRPEVSIANPQEIPDIQPVINSVTGLIQETNKKQADFTKVVEGLNKVAENLAKLPTEYPETKIPEPIDYTEKFDELKGAIKPPIVNVPKQDIKIPDYSKELKDLLEAIKKIKIPVIPKSDTGSVVKAIKDLQRFISGLSIPSGGGGLSGGLTDIELRASAVPIEISDGTDTLPIGAVSTATGVATASGDTTILTVGASEIVRIFHISFVPTTASSTDRDVKLITGTTDRMGWRTNTNGGGFATSPKNGQGWIQGALGEDVILNLSGADSIRWNLHYQLV